MMKPDVLDFEKPLPMDAFDLADSKVADPHDFAISGMSVVISDAQDLPALVFADSPRAQAEDSRQHEVAEFKLSQPAPAPAQRDRPYRKAA